MSALNGIAPFASTTNNHHFLAYDPYNTVRPFCCINSDTGAHLQQTAYGYQQAIESEQQLNLNLNLIRPPQTSITNLIANPIFSSSAQAAAGDSSSFRASQLEQDLCPSYEEAIASTGYPLLPETAGQVEQVLCDRRETRDAEPVVDNEDGGSAATQESSRADEEPAAGEE